jgi:hypothetical protein
MPSGSQTHDGVVRTTWSRPGTTNLRRSKSARWRPEPSERASVDWFLRIAPSGDSVDLLEADDYDEMISGS